MNHILRINGLCKLIHGSNSFTEGLQVGLDGKRDWNHDLTACCERPGLTTAACLYVRFVTTQSPESPILD